MAQKAIDDITTKRMYLGNVEPKNPVAEVALAELNDTVAKNTELWLAAEVASRRGIKNRRKGAFLLLLRLKILTSTDYFAENRNTWRRSWQMKTKNAENFCS